MNYWLTCRQNLEYARSLLLRLEHDSSSIKIQSRKQSIQTDLQSKREQIKRLNERLQELEQLHADFDDDDLEEEDETDDETDRPSYAPAKPAFPGLEAGKEEQEPAPNINPPQSTSELRSRKAAQQSQPAATSTGAGVVFPSDYRSSKSTEPLPDPNVSQAESLLSHNRQEQENISDELLVFAQRLKESSLRFQSTLEQDKGVMDRAGAGLDKNTSGMESASSRMGMLRRMTEGRGWWARISLYGRIAILWVVALVIVFVLPKLRF